MKIDNGTGGSQETSTGKPARVDERGRESINFLTELKRRNVYKVAVAYAVVAWLLMQIASQIFPFFEIPNWAVRLVVLLLIIGFPIALIIAWAFEVTPEGIKRTEAADAVGQRSRGGAWIYIVLIGAAVSVGLFFVGRYTAGRATLQPASAELRRGEQGEATAAIPQKSIAVLPLLNESGDPKDEYFSDGLSEELIAALAQISGLKVIGRSSSFRFKDRKEEPKTIGEKLDVATLLDGTVRKQGDRVRIVAELLNAADGIQLWTRTFDRELKDIFAVQQEIAKARAALRFLPCLVDWNFADGLTELKSEKELSPTNPTAKDLLARFIVYLGRFDEAERQARQAVELDPLSTVTQGNLARVLFYAGKLDEADAAARKAAELQPAGASNHRWQVLIAAQRGDGEAALREAQLEPDEGYRRFELAVAQYVVGDRQAADAALAHLIAKAREGFAYQIAEVYAVRGEKDKASDWLQISFDDRDAGMLGLLVDPLLRSLRDDPRYKNLLAKLGLPGTS